MYLELVKANLVEALRDTFDQAYPREEFRNLRASIEYPVAQADYPGVWVQYSDTAELTTAGIGHVEYVQNAQGKLAPVTRWKFGGTLTMTVTTLSSLECDRIYDELVKVLAFAKVNPSLSDFRRIVERSDLIAMNGNFDNLRPSGDNAGPGTPWGTEEIIYEKSISMDVIGEFVSEPEFGEMVNLRKIIVHGYVEGTPEPPFGGQPDYDLDPGAPGSTPHGMEIHSPRDWI